MTYAFLDAIGVDLSSKKGAEIAQPARPVPGEPGKDLQPPRDYGGLSPAQHLFLGFSGTAVDAATAALLHEFRPGGVLLRKENLVSPEQTRALVEQIWAAAGLGGAAGAPFFILLDQEEGERSESNPLGLDNSPTAQQLGAQNDSEAAREAGRRCGAAVRGRGIGVVLAPVLDVFDPGTSDPAIEARCFGADPDTVAALGAAFAEGLLEGGVLPVVKHYPGMGAAMRHEDGSYVIEKTDMVEVAKSMVPFVEACDRKLPGILVGHVSVPAINGESATQTASLSPRLVRKALRDTWSFEGVIVAADISTHPRATAEPRAALVVRALQAGCDAVIITNVDPEGMDAVCAAILSNTNTGLLSADRLDESKMRLAAWQAKLNHLPGVPLVPVPESLPEPGETRVDVPAPEVPDTETVPPEAPAPEVPNSETVPPEAPAPEVPDTETVAPETPPAEERPPAEAPGPETRMEEQVEGETAPAAPDEAPLQDEGTEETGATPEPAVEEPPEESPPQEKPAEEVASGEPSEAEAPQEESAIEAAKDQPPQTPPEEDTAPPDTTPKEGAPKPVLPPPNTKAFTHRIQRGETLVAIARQHSVRVSDITAWNNLSGSTIKWGQTLTIYLPLDEDQEPTPQPAEETETAPTETEQKSPSETLKEDAISPAAPPQPENTIRREHTVREGDTPASIAERFGVPQADLWAWNSLKSETLLPGAVVVVYLPVAVEEKPEEPEQAYTTHQVRRGDTGHGIAARYGTTAQELARLNGLDNMDRIYAGQRLKVPALAP